MYCTILRFRGAVSFNQVPYPAGTVSSSSSCRRRPPWNRLLLALALGLSQTLPHNLGAPPLQEGESTDDEWQPCGREHPSQAPFPQHSTKVNSIWTLLSARTLAWLKLCSISSACYFQCDFFFFKLFPFFMTRYSFFSPTSQMKKVELDFGYRYTNTSTTD